LGSATWAEMYIQMIDKQCAPAEKYVEYRHSIDVGETATLPQREVWFVKEEKKLGEYHIWINISSTVPSFTMKICHC
jgi:hypothetical protein